MIKRVVWDVLQTIPPAGMPPELVIANRHLEPVIAGQPYKAGIEGAACRRPVCLVDRQGHVARGIITFPRMACSRGNRRRWATIRSPSIEPTARVRSIVRWS